MTVCSGGSSTQAGAPLFINLGEEEVKGLLPSSWSWIGQYIPYMGAINESTATLCAADPPVCSLTATDLLGLLVPPLGTGNVIQKLRDCVLAQAWSDYCQCNAGSASCSSCTTESIGLGPVNFWELAESTGASQAFDQITSTFDANYTNGPTLGVAGPVSGCNGMLTTAASPTCGLDCPLSFSVSHFSWNVWLKTTATGTRYIWYYGASGTASGMYMACVGNKLQVDIITPGNVDQLFAGTTTINDGAWHMLTMTYDGTTLRSYVDAVAQGSVGAVPSSTLTRLQLGGQFGGVSTVQVPGTYGLPAIWNRALSPSEVTTLHAACSGGAFIPPKPPEPSAPTGLPPSPTWTCSTTGDVCEKLFELNNKIQDVQAVLQWLAGIQTAGGYVQGTPVTGITGAGTLASAALLGVLVNFTTIPATWGFTKETPKRYVPTLGSIRFGTPDAFGNWNQINYQETILFGDVQLGALTQLHYWLAPGTIATMTPLLAAK